MPFGTVSGMNDKVKPRTASGDRTRSSEGRGLAGRFIDQVKGARAEPEDEHAPRPASSSPETLRQDAEASAHILRRLMPKPAKSDEPKDEVEGTASAAEGSRILLADDEPMMRNSLRMMLEQCGYHVVTAETGEEAWSIFSKRPNGFDLLISDISMPALDGASLAHRIRLLRPHLRIILMSGYFDEKAASDLMKDGRVEFMPKPFGLDQLADRVRRALKSR